MKSSEVPVSGMYPTLPNDVVCLLVCQKQSFLIYFGLQSAALEWTTVVDEYHKMTSYQELSSIEGFLMLLGWLIMGYDVAML